MASFVPTDPETLEDQRRYTQARLVRVECLDCLAVVGVKKNSDHHTSVQWSAEAVEQCPDLARRTTDGGGRQRFHACPRMTASIEAAVSDGRLPVGAEDGY